MPRKPPKLTNPERRKTKRRKDTRTFAEKAVDFGLSHDRRMGAGRRKTDKHQ